MRVSVYQNVGAMVRDDFGDRRFGCVHDVVRLVGVCGPALRAHRACERASFGERLRFHLVLPLRRAKYRAGPLIRDVVDAQRVAVTQQQPFAVALDQGRIVDQFEAARSREVVANQKIAIAVHQADAAARRCVEQLRFERYGERRVVIVADPDLGQVTENVEFVTLRRLAPQNAAERIQTLRRGSVERGGRDGRAWSDTDEDRMPRACASSSSPSNAGLPPNAGSIAEAWIASYRSTDARRTAA